MPLNSCKFANLLMLLLVACWGTGLNRAIHESTDHDAAPAAQAAELPGASFGVLALDDHDGCMTCQQLAVGVVGALIAFVVALVGVAVIGRLRVDGQSALQLCAFLPALPICGPPMAIA